MNNLATLLKGTDPPTIPRTCLQSIGCTSYCLSDGHFLQATGVEFPAVTHFWEGEAFRSLGAAVRQKKIAFVGVKVSFIGLSAINLTALPGRFFKSRALAWSSSRWRNVRFPEGAAACAVCSGDRRSLICHHWYVH